MSLEGILFEQEKGNSKAPVRDAENYFVEIFGKPGNDQIWGGAGLNTLLGGAGDDIIVGGSTHHDVINGGTGTNQIWQ